jgi:NADP-dependent aldehyde dehydrogenase
MLHAGISKSYHKGLESMARVSGVTRLAVSDTFAQAGESEGEPAVYATDSSNFLEQRELHEEVFGPYTLLVDAQDPAEFLEIARTLEGQLTATVHGTPEDLAGATELLDILERKAGRLLINGFPTGVDVCPSMNHGGPYPATTDVRFTSVGTASIQRWARPICYQNFPESALPQELRNSNPRGLMRLVNGHLTRDAVSA